MPPVDSPTATDAPTEMIDLSVVMPCYNEADCLGETVPPLASALAKTGHAFEIILVDNGSTDRTADVINELCRGEWPIQKATVPVNRGQGLGIRTGLEMARGRVIGYTSADGQVEPQDVVRVALATVETPRLALSKALRRERYDGLERKVISLGYNALFFLLYPGIGSSDVNANPKFMSREAFERMELESEDWFLEAEIMLKARHLRLPVLEVEVGGRPRQGGKSHVRFAAILEFIGNMLRYRVGGPWKAWRRRTGPIDATADVARQPVQQ